MKNIYKFIYKKKKPCLHIYAAAAAIAIALFEEYAVCYYFK